MTDPFEQAKSIVAKLVRAGYTTYFAGGWVRDFVLGHPSEDIDIATEASAAEIMDLFPHTILVGLAFNVVIVVLEGHQFEVATFRKDLQYVDGRHPVGIEMANPREDALRRDFTINGLFYDPLEEEIHDFVHGLEDIRGGVIRAIGNPYDRFFEDRLRMLRAFRFSARFGFNIDGETQEAIRQNADKLLPSVAMERVWQEFTKMAAYPKFDDAIVQMHRLSLLDVIFPEIVGMHIKDLRHKVNHFSHFPSDCPTILYLMEILHTLSLETKIEIAKRLKVPNRDLKLIEFMEQLNACVAQDSQDRYRLVSLLAQPDWELCLKILALRYPDGQLLEKYYLRYAQLEKAIKRLQEGKPLVSSGFLQQQGIKPGKKMGLLLKEAELIAINENLDDPEKVLAKLLTSPNWEI